MNMNIKNYTDLLEYLKKLIEKKDIEIKIIRTIKKKVKSWLPK